MAAHLHRYGSEIKYIADTIEDIEWYNKEFHTDFVKVGIRSPQTLGSFMKSFGEITAQMTAISCFRDEMQQKIDNVLALLVDNMQAMNDRLLVQNSKAMQEILAASKEEAKQSRELAAQTQELTKEMNNILKANQDETAVLRRLAHQTHRLTEEMRKDSVSMKTVALLTAFFLPGTSFAAILEMPFFSQNQWLGSIGRVWLWVALTVPATSMCFWFYISWGRHESRRSKELRDADAEMINVGAAR
ncbi:uncharacterized protein A1O9_10268 [Exophiala aquamarina CBS 119918]|uniref:Uncharacterized protein n=1 Tax=Exophiala aquamarina CBS 119918 TaxID=1182545 RepID=A0A072P208_9EURO|nr:uncharacterized protein A1O9_10268 [Exophiala aquamarina CBS 119918]KEF53866.1 hypothetical protein A1O9_10268 [Exophiala aquamarina CBS 119918]